jgi:hypothetical protein
VCICHERLTALRTFRSHSLDKLRQIVTTGASSVTVRRLCLLPPVSCWPVTAVRRCWDPSDYFIM